MGHIKDNEHHSQQCHK